jgi:hypothetical protein
LWHRDSLYAQRIDSLLKKQISFEKFNWSINGSNKGSEIEKSRLKDDLFFYIKKELKL